MAESSLSFAELLLAGWVQRIPPDKLFRFVEDNKSLVQYIHELKPEHKKLVARWFKVITTFVDVNVIDEKKVYSFLTMNNPRLKDVLARRPYWLPEQVRALKKWLSSPNVLEKYLSI